MVLSHEDLSQVELASWGQSCSSCNSKRIISVLKGHVEGDRHQSIPQKAVRDTGLHLGWRRQEAGVEESSEHECSYLEVT